MHLRDQESSLSAKLSCSSFAAPHATVPALQMLCALLRRAQAALKTSEWPFADGTHDAIAHVPASTFVRSL